MRPSPNPKRESGSKLSGDVPPFLQKKDWESVDGSKPIPRKRNFEVVDSNALYELYPQFFKLVPDYAKIRQAMKLGLAMPGINFIEANEKGE